MSTTPELIAVMPVFNEQASIRNVASDWFEVLDRNVGNFVMLVIDDGSTDETPKILKGLAERFGNRLEIRSRPNRGHGQTCLEGYRIASEREIPYILQVDSDGQCDPSYFHAFWQARSDYDVIYGLRQREDGFRRILASRVLRCLLRSAYRVDCIDPNVPYRLMATRDCAAAFQAIPPDFFLANVALAVLLRKQEGIRHGSVPIRFLERTGGEPSVPLSKFLIKALELFRQMRSLGI